MANPSVSTVTIDGTSFSALSIHFGIATVHDFDGMPNMGSLRTTVEVTVDAHDTDNLPFDALQKFYGLANLVNRDKIKDIKLEFWKDDAQNDAICTWSFRGWINNFSMSSASGGNHTLSLSLQPELDEKQYVNIPIGN